MWFVYFGTNKHFQIPEWATHRTNIWLRPAWCELFQSRCVHPCRTSDHTIRRAVQSLHQSLLRKQSDHVGMAPNKRHRKKNAEGDMGEGDDIVLLVMEVVTDERGIQLLQKALYRSCCLISSPKWTRASTVWRSSSQPKKTRSLPLRRGSRSWRRAHTVPSSILDGRTCWSADWRKPGKPRTPTAESSRWWMMRWSWHRPCRLMTSPEATGSGRRARADAHTR